MSYEPSLVPVDSDIPTTLILAAEFEARKESLVEPEELLVLLPPLDARKVRVIELRFFAGLTVDETAAVLDVAADTVARDWRLARSWLLQELNPQTDTLR